MLDLLPAQTSRDVPVRPYSTMIVRSMATFSLILDCAAETLFDSSSLPQLSPHEHVVSPAPQPPTCSTFHCFSLVLSCHRLPSPPLAAFCLVVHLQAFLSSVWDAHSSLKSHQDSSCSSLGSTQVVASICKSVLHDHTSSRFSKYCGDVCLSTYHTLLKLSISLYLFCTLSAP